MPLCGRGKTVSRKLVLLYAISLIAPRKPSLTYIRRGDGACGKTSLLNVFTRGWALSVPMPSSASPF